MKEIIKKLKNKYIIASGIALIVVTVTLSIILLEDNKVITTSTANVELSSKKIGWGIKRNDNHEQPDLGKVNKQIIDEAKGIAMGNKESKKV